MADAFLYNLYTYHKHTTQGNLGSFRVNMQLGREGNESGNLTLFSPNFGLCVIYRALARVGP